MLALLSGTLVCFLAQCRKLAQQSIDDAPRVQQF
jgi:hypothetical protein